MRPELAYAELIRRTKEHSLLASCAELLAWDEDTYMPPAGAEHRAAQLALLAGLQHERATDPRLGDLFAAVEGSALVADPESDEAVNVREIRRSHERQTHLPRELVEELARITSLAEREWAAARRAADFRRFRPWLEKIIQLKRREAEALDLTPDLYDALLDGYEPGVRGDDLAVLFDALRCELLPLVNAIAYDRPPPDTTFLNRAYPVAQQRAFGEAVGAAVGFDFRRGRLDTTTHPFFSTIGPGDCRITTRFAEHNFSDGFFGLLHEVGHGLYEQGLPIEHHGTPRGEVLSLGLHESQARLWENAVGRSWAFWQHFFPRAQAAFPSALGDVGLDHFHSAINAVKPTLIRVGADEVTYNLHVLIRFELERALLAGDLRLPISPVPGRKPTGITSAWCRPTTRRGACKTVIGRRGCSAIFPPTRSGTSSRLSSWPGPGNSSATSTRPLPAATLAACCAGCANKSTSRADAPRPGD